MLDFSLLGRPPQCLLSGSQQQERQDETWEGLLPHTSERWQDKKRPKRRGKPQTQPDKTSREQSLRMIHQYQRLVSSHDSSLCSQQQHELHTLCEAGLLDRALDALFRMDMAPPISVYMSLLKQCNKSKSLTHAKRVHAHVSVHCLEPTGLLADYLVVTLATCGAIEDALQMFHGLANRTVFSWTAIISAYTDCGWAQEALEMFQCMEEDGIEPNHYTFVSLFKACGIIPNVKEGKKLHADANRKGFASDVFIGNTLVSMYGKCGAIVEAENVFRGMSQLDVVSWNAMLCAYVDQGHPEKALQLYRQMQEEGVIPNQRTFSIALQACNFLAEKEEGSLARGPSKLVTWELGQAIHADARRKGFASEVVVGTALVSMYSKCGNIVDAENVFRALCEHDVISWTALHTAYIVQDQEVKALQLYVQMQGEGVSPNQQTLMIALQACGILAGKEGVHSKTVMPLVIGKALHECALTRGYATDLLVGNALVTLFGKCGAIAEAETVFCRLSQRDIVSWNAMLSAYIEQGHGEKALQLYKQMKEEGVSPDELTFVIALQACGTLAEKEKATDLEGQSAKVMSLEIGLALHNEACQGGFALDLLVGNTLVSMYGNCGTIVEAENVFDGLSQCDVVSWNAMLSAYVEQGQGERAWQLYRQMQNKGVSLTDVTLICILQACSELGSLETCKHLHYTIVSSGFDLNLSLAATLIHAYGSCGSMADAQAVLDGLPQPVIVSRNACFAGYAGEGNCVATAQMFNEMQLAGIKPDEVTFASLLSSCSHAGLVIQGLQYFESMRKDYGIAPNLIHYGSMVDLLGRAGDFKRIYNILGRMPMQADLTLWLNLLVACRVHGNGELGKEVFDHAVNLQPKEAGAYVLMSNICADAGLPAETRHVEARIEND